MLLSSGKALRSLAFTIIRQIIIIIIADYVSGRVLTKY